MSSPVLVLAVAGIERAAPLDMAADSIASLDETAIIGFRIENAEPGVDYRLLIGTEPVDDAREETPARPEDAPIEWAASPYLESARGPTRIAVESRTDSGEWQPRGGMLVDVAPAKLGETQYRALFEELRAISPALVFDVRGKSGRASGAAADDLVESWRRAVTSILNMAAVLHANDDRRLRPRPGRNARRALALMSARDPARSSAVRQVATLLDILECGLRRIQRDTQLAADAIRSGGLELRGLSRARSLYDVLDAPRLLRVLRVHDSARDVLADVRALRTREPFARTRSLVPFLPAPQEPAHGRQAIRMLHRAVATARSAESGGSYVRPTSRMYEQWVFLRLARALASAAISPLPFEQLLESIRRRGSVGLQRGTGIEFALPSGRFVTVRYEPIIRSRALRHPDDAFVRSHAGVASPFVPDILVSVAAANVVRTVVLDAKYTRLPRAQAWAGVERYFTIRHAATGRSAVDEVWIVAPTPTQPDASGVAGESPPDGWRGGLLPLVPGSATPHAWLPAGGQPHRFTSLQGGPGSYGRGAVSGDDGATIALRAFAAHLLFGGLAA